MRGLFKVPFHDDEAIVSMWGRLAIANGTTARLFSLDQGLKFQDVATGDPSTIARMAEVMGLDQDFLNARALVRLEPRDTRLCGNRFVSHKSIFRTTIRFCPQCLQEDDQRDHRFPTARRYYRLQWQVRAVRSCPHHNCSIVQGPAPNNANMNFDFSRYNQVYAKEIRASGATSVPLAFSRFERFIYDRLAGKLGHGDFLDSISLSLAIDMIEQAGICLQYGKTANLETRLTVPERHASSELAFAYLERGSVGLNECLDRIAGDCGYVFQAGGVVIYGNLYNKVRERREPDDYVAYEAMRKHALQRFPITQNCSIFGPMIESRWVSLQTWTKENNIHLTTMLKLLENMRQDGTFINTTAGADLIDIDFANEVLQFWQGLVTSTEIERILGVGVETMRLIHRQNFFEPVLRKEKHIRYTRYARANVEDFLSKVLPKTPTTDITGLFPFKSAIKRAHAVQGTVLRLLYEGLIKRVGLDPEMPRGIYALLLDPTELKPLIASRIAPELTETDILDVSGTAKVMGVGERCVWDLIRYGCLPGVRLSETTQNARNFAQRVRLTDIDEFKAKYIHGNEITEKFGLSRHALKLIMKKHTPHIDGVFSTNIRGLFYHREAFEDLSLQNLLRAAGDVGKAKAAKNNVTGSLV